MNGLQRRALGVLLVVCSMVLAGCVGSSTDTELGTEETAEAVYAWEFTNPKDLVATAPLIVLGTVERVDRGRIFDQGEETETTRLLTVRIEKRLAGTVTGDHLVIEDQGWIRRNGKEVPFRLLRMMRLEAGDRAYLFLRTSPGTSYYEQLNHQAAYRLEGNQLADSSRDDAMARLVELMTAAQFENLIGQARAEVKQGKLRATPRGRARAG
jgi:hypothetical protein